MKKLNKKGLELTINFIVLLILGMAMLGGALALSKKIFSQAKDYQATVDSQTDENLKRLMTDSDSLVVIYPKKKTIPRKKSGTFGIGVQNIRNTDGPEDDFEIFVEFREAFDKKNEPICKQDGVQGPEYDKSDIDCNNIDHPTNGWINTGDPHKTIKKNQLFTFNTLITVDKGVPSGLYLFDIKVCEADKIGIGNAAADCEGMDRKDVYGGIIHKLQVRVE